MKGKKISMIQDIFTKPIEIELLDQKYELEYDHNSLIKLEHKTDKGIFEILDRVVNSQLSLEECNHLAVCSLLKHNDILTVQKLEELFEQMPYLLVQNCAAFCAAFMQSMVAPEVFQQQNKQEAENTGKK